jgi:MurNAc alpha-1-phosphate uridylyltransferase
MKAMILAAGFGTRLGQITQHTPKCLVSIGGNQTILEHVVQQLKQVGVQEIVINLHYLADQVRDFVRSHNSFGITVSFSSEETILGTGGGIKHAQRLLEGGESFIIHNGDVFSELNLSSLVAYHHQHSAIATLAVMQRPTSRALIFSKTGALIGKQTAKGDECIAAGEGPQRLAFSGIQVITQQFFKYLERYTGEFSSITAYLEAAKCEERVLAYDMGDTYWMDMGQPERLEELRVRRSGLENKKIK